MSVIKGTSAGFKDMADGSLRITFEFEPADASTAVALFGPRGRAVAIAALKDGADAKSDAPIIETQIKPDKAKGGALAQSAGIVCHDQRFQAYARSKGYAPSAEGARDLILLFCNIDSRAELDHEPSGAARYRTLMANFREWGEVTA